MAAYSISFASATRRPWLKSLAVVGTLAPDTGQLLEIRVADAITDSGEWSHEEIYNELEKLIAQMRETRKPPLT